MKPIKELDNVVVVDKDEYAKFKSSHDGLFSALRDLVCDYTCRVPKDQHNAKTREKVRQALAEAQTEYPKQLSPEDAHGIAATMPETGRGEIESVKLSILACVEEEPVLICKSLLLDWADRLDKALNLPDCQGQERPEAKCRNCGKLFYCEDDYNEPEEETKKS